MRNFIEKHHFNPFLVYLISFLICWVWTGFDVSNLAGLAVWAAVGMIPVYFIIAAIVGLFIF